MMPVRRFLFLIIASALAVFASAHAQTFDCHDDMTEEECAKERAYDEWYQVYGLAYDVWWDQLLFNRDIYFADYDGKAFSLDRVDMPNMVDARRHRSMGSYRSEWAFAIDVVNNKPIARMVTFISDDSELRPGDEGKLESLLYPTSLQETAEKAGILAKWMEADLRTCDGALDQLSKFPGQSDPIPIWAPEFMAMLGGKEISNPEKITITMDGDAIHVRAREQHDPARCCTDRGEATIIFKDSNGGHGYYWAWEMYDAIKPCLVPSQSVPPWEKILSYRSELGLE